MPFFSAGRRAAHLLKDGYDIRAVPELLGHKAVSTMMIYTQVPRRGDVGESKVPPTNFDDRTG